MSVAAVEKSFISLWTSEVPEKNAKRHLEEQIEKIKKSILSQ